MQRKGDAREVAHRDFLPARRFSLGHRRCDDALRRVPGYFAVLSLLRVRRISWPSLSPMATVIET